MRFAAFELFFNGADVHFFSNIFNGTRRNGVDLKISNAVKKYIFEDGHEKKLFSGGIFGYLSGGVLEKNVGGGTRRKN